MLADMDTEAQAIADLCLVFLLGQGVAGLLRIDHLSADNNSFGFTIRFIWIYWYFFSDLDLIIYDFRVLKAARNDLMNRKVDVSLMIRR